MPTIRVGLCNGTTTVDFAEVKRIAAALDIQARCHIGSIWSIDATVEAVPDALKIPADMSPIIIVDDLPNHGGDHGLTKNGRAFARISASRDWRLAASHECIEMLVDPRGDNFKESLAVEVVDGVVRDTVERVRYLVEACDPLQDPSFAYSVGGCRVSDFYTPEYFDDAVRPGVKYSFTGAITRPRQVLHNGYISWVSAAGHFVQLHNAGGPTIQELPDHAGAMSMEGFTYRSFVDHHTVAPKDYCPKVTPGDYRPAVAPNHLD